MQALTLVALLVCTGLAVINSEPQFAGYPHPIAYPYFNNQFRSGEQEGRFFFATQTLTVATATTTRTVTSITSCTTSTAALSACVASGRRRRNAKALFYDDDTEETIFLPSPAERTEVAVEKVVEPVRSTREAAVVPIFLDPGFASANGVAPRFLLAFTTTTRTLTTTTTSISSVIAICSSTTGFQLCGNNGK